MRTKRADTTATASPWRLRNIFKGRKDCQDHVDGSAFFSGELDAVKNAEWQRLDDLDDEKRKNAIERLEILDIRPSRHREDISLLDDFLKSSKVMQAFPDAFGAGKVEAVFVYRRDEQADELKDVWGYANYIEDGDAKCYLVGLSTDTLERGTAYATGLFLHELAHCDVDAAGGDLTAHNERFTEAVQKRAKQYERATGRRVSFYAVEKPQG